VLATDTDADWRKSNAWRRWRNNDRVENDQMYRQIAEKIDSK